MNFSFKYLLQLFAIALVLGWTQNLFAQKSRIDSIQNALKHQRGDTAEVNTLNSLAWQVRLQNLDSAIQLSEEALEKAKKMSQSKNKSMAIMGTRYIAQSNFQLGSFNRKLGEFLKALNYFNTSLTQWEELIGTELHIHGLVGQAKTLSSIGILFDSQGNHAKALEYYFKALQLAEQIKNPILTSGIIGNIGVVYSFLKDYDKALEYYNKSLKLGEEMGDLQLISGNLANIGDLVQLQGDFTKATYYLEKAMVIELEMKDDIRIAYLIGKMGSICLDRGDSAKKNGASKEFYMKLFREGVEYYDSSKRVLERIGEKFNLAYRYRDLGVIYFEMQEFDKSEKAYLESLKMAYELEAWELIASNADNLSQLYVKLGKDKLAYENYKLFIAYTDSINNEDQQKKQLGFELTYEFDKKTAVLNEQQEKERIIVREKNRFQNIVIAAVGFGLLMVLAFAVFVFRSLKKTRLQKNMIEEKQKEILDSIYYARRIQRALITSDRNILKNLTRLKK